MALEDPTRYPPSYYAASLREPTGYPALEGDARADVCIVGGGYTGLSAALHLAESGFKVRLLEARLIGWGASGRNGGQLGTSLRHAQPELEKSCGPDWSRRLWELACESHTLVKDLIARHDIQCGLKPGILHAAWKRKDAEELLQEARHMQAHYGQEQLRYMGRDEIREAVASKRYWGGVYDRDGAHLHPLNFALGLARAAREAGAEIHEQTTVRSVSRTEPSFVETDWGTITADFVIYACNGYLDGLEPRIAPYIMPINNYIIATEPLSEGDARRLIRDDAAVQDTKFVVDYYRLSEDRRLLFGGGETYSRRFPRDIASFVRKPMLRVFPQLETVRIDYAWGGTLAITLNRMPHFQKMQPNAIAAHGYSGQGLNMAVLAGRLLSEAIAGQAERYDLLANFPTPSFPGGTYLRHPGLVAGMLFYALRDRLP